MGEYIPEEMKSFRLWGEKHQFVADAFISFKTDPDLRRAQYVAETFSAAGAKVNFIYGDSECPHLEGTAEAEAWISGYLIKRLHAAPFLFCIASEGSVESRWVNLEFLIGIRNSKSVVILWFDGPEPFHRYLPLPRWLPCLLPLSPIYLVDLRDGDADATLNALAEATSDWPREQRRSWLWKVMVFVSFMLVASAPFIIQETWGSLPLFPCGVWAMLWLVAAILLSPAIRLIPKAAQKHANVTKLNYGLPFPRFAYAFGAAAPFLLYHFGFTVLVACSIVFVLGPVLGLVGLDLILEFTRNVPESRSVTAPNDGMHREPPTDLFY